MYAPSPPVAVPVHTTDSLTVTRFGLALHETVKMFTVNVFESVAVPPPPVHVSVYVVVDEGETLT